MPATEVVVVKESAAIPVTATGPTLVYWDICGLAQPIRYALELQKIEYVDVRIDAGEATSDDYKQIWFTRKGDLDSPFANLPYFLDGGVTVQSNAILRKIGRVDSVVIFGIFSIFFSFSFFFFFLNFFLIFFFIFFSIFSVLLRPSPSFDFPLQAPSSLGR